MESPYVSEDDAIIKEQAPKTQVSKRKHVGDNTHRDASSNKKRKAKKQGNVDRDDIDEEHHYNRTIASMDGNLLADLFARQTKRFESKLSVVELEDKRMPSSAFIDTSMWSQPRALDVLPQFLENFTSRSHQQIAKASSTNGSPHTIVVAASGIRAADLTRSLRVFQGEEAKIAKLFAKHIKLRDACDFLDNTRINIAVGTPQRLIDASKAGSLRLDEVGHIIVDASHVDAKRRGLLDIRETEVPTINFLGAIRGRLSGDGPALDRHFVSGSKKSKGDVQKSVRLVVF